MQFPQRANPWRFAKCAHLSQPAIVMVWHSERTRTDRFLLSRSGMRELSIDELTELVIACAIAVHNTLGPGLLESVHADALAIELVAAGLAVERERRVPIIYRGERVRDDLKPDLLVKAVERIISVHLAQVITYLKLTGFPAGLLFNFNTTSLRAGLRRIDHPDIYAKKHSRTRNGQFQ